MGASLAFPSAPLAVTSFTPTFTFATPGNLSNSYTVQEGKAWRFGSLVVFRIGLAWTPTHTTASGAGLIGGLPHTSAATTRNMPIAGSIARLTYLAGQLEQMARVGPSATTITIAMTSSAGNFANAIETNFISGTAFIAELCGAYEAA